MGMLILLRACSGGAPPEITKAAAVTPVDQISTYSPSPEGTSLAVGMTDSSAPGAAGMADGTMPGAAGMTDSSVSDYDPLVDPLGGEPTMTPEPTPSIPTSQELAKAAAAARAATESPTAEPTPTATASVVRKMDPKKAAALAAKQQKARIAAAAKKGCGLDALEVNVRSDKRVYERGEKPKLFISVKNISDLPCRVDLGSDALSFVVTSGEDRVWSSDDCQGKGSKDVRVLKPGQALEARAVWGGARSAPGCPKGQPEARPGTYVVDGRAGEAAPERRAVFTVKE